MKFLRRLTLVAVLLFSLGSAHAETLGSLVKHVRHHVGDLSNPKVTYSDSFVADTINDIQREVVNATWCLSTSTSITLVAQTTYYALPTNLIAIQQVLFTNRSGLTAELTEVAEKSWIQQNPDYERQSGTPTQYFVRMSTYAASTLEFAPQPTATTSSTGTVRINYFNQSTDLSAVTDVPFDGYQYLYPYHRILEYGAAARLFLMRGDAARAEAYTKIYTDMLTTMTNRIGQMPNYAPGFRSTTR